MCAGRCGAAVALGAWLLCPFHGATAQDWQQLGGPEGGTVLAMEFHPPSGAIFAGTGWQTSYVATPNAGAVYRSLDRGATWQEVSQDISAAVPTMCRVRGLSVSLSGEILAGLDGGGVFRSIDGGQHWAALNSGLTHRYLRAVGHDAAGTKYAVTDTGGVFTSPAANSAWVATNAGLSSLNTTCFASGPGFVLVGTSDLGVFKRVGNGPWAAASSGLPAGPVTRIIRAAAGALYALAGNGLYTSVDDAVSWTSIPGPSSGVSLRSLFEWGGALIAGGDFAIYRSVGSGPWVTVANGFTGFGPTAFCGDLQGRIYCGTLDSGVFRTDDIALGWSQSNSGLRAISVHRLVVTPSGSIIAGTRQSGIFRSPDLGATWEPPVLEHRLIFSLAISPWGDLFAGNYTIAGGVPDGHAWRSTDDGSTWAPLDNGMTSAMVSGFAFSGVVGEVWNSSAWNPGGVTYSSTSGLNWSRFGPPQNIPAYCLLRTPSGDLYFGSEGQQVWKYQASTGQWQPKGLQQSQQFALARDSAGNIFVGNDRNLKGFYRSTDDGATFLPLNNFPGNDGYAMLVLPNDELFAGTSVNGIQHSTDHGDTWTTMNAGMATGACFALALGPDGHIYAGGAGGGVYRSSLAVSCAPSIVTQPQPASGCLGGSAQFSVIADAPGGGALTFRWRRNQVGIEGAIQSVLTIPHLLQGDDGMYDCLVTSACGTTPSAAVRLRVCSGDINGDGMVNTLDLTIILASFGQGVPACASGDQNADAQVNTLDLTILIGAFGNTCP